MRFLDDTRLMSDGVLRAAIVPVAYLALLLGVACSEGSQAPIETPSNDDEAEAALSASRDRFARVQSFRTRFAMEAEDVEGRFEGEAAYASNNVLYWRGTYVDAALAEDEPTGFLFLPPDLYVQQQDGSWVVISPWNQGTDPDEQQAIGFEKPLINYAEFTQDMREVERQPDDLLDGQAFERYSGSIKVSDLDSLFPEGTSRREVADVDLWLHKGSGLPATIEITRRESHATIEFTDYDQLASAPAAPPGARPLRDVEFPSAPCTGSELAACLEAADDVHGSDSCEGSGRRICLVPLGRISSSLVDHLVNHYRDQYGLDVTVLGPASVPAELEDPLREQVDGIALVDYMVRLFPNEDSDPDAVLIGITVVDLYDSTSHFRYVFGVKGTPADPKGLVSTFRMDPQFYGEPPDVELLRSRTRKMLSKYIGFLYYGLPTSSDPESPMFNSILGPEDLDQMTEPLPVGSGR